MSTQMSEADFAQLSGEPVPKRSKYRAVPVIVTLGDEIYEAKAAKANGITGTRFASKAEARRYLELVMLQRAGQISGLECQPKFEIHAVNGTKVGSFRADFRYYDRPLRTIVCEEIKGSRATKTEAYRLRKKLVEAEHSVLIREVFR